LRGEERIEDVEGDKGKTNRMGSLGERWVTPLE